MKLEADHLSSLDGITHGFFTRKGGVSTGVYDSLNCGLGSNDDPACVLENRSRVAHDLDIHPQHLVFVHQTHSVDVAHVDETWNNKTQKTDTRPKADAMVTSVSGYALGILTADCGPVLFVDPKARVIGAAHAGWAGAFKGILENTVAAMQKLGAEPSHIHAVLGPSISVDSYEVGEEFIARFIKVDELNHRYFHAAKRPQHAMFDLQTYITDRLKQIGLSSVKHLNFCTYQDPTLFFSYRRATHIGETDYGRHVSAIALI